MSQSGIAMEDLRSSSILCALDPNLDWVTARLRSIKIYKNVDFVFEVGMLNWHPLFDKTALERRALKAVLSFPHLSTISSSEMNLEAGYEPEGDGEADFDEILGVYQLSPGKYLVRVMFSEFIVWSSAPILTLLDE